MPAPFDLKRYEIEAATVIRNAAPARLYEDAIIHERAAVMASGAIAVRSGAKTGRSPKDKRIVDHPASRDEIWWGDVNIPLDEHIFVINRQRAIDYLNTRAHDLRRRRLRRLGPAVSAEDPRDLRAALSCPVHAQHADPSHGGGADRVRRARLRDLQRRRVPGQSPHHADDLARPASTLSFERGEFVILGTEYAGEMKKGDLHDHELPDAASRACSRCTARPTKGPTGDVSLFFGLSGTGKTTLSADPRRELIGDDEHCWSDDGVFNIEGGCYAKCIHLSAENEPEIFQAIRFGSVLENVVYDEQHASVDYASDSHHREHARQLSDRVHPQRQDSLRRRPSAEHHLLAVRRLRRAAAGEQAHAGPGDVSLHQRLHGQSGRHGNRA